jgi:membrane-associated phospholipid phosphatase
MNSLSSKPGSKFLWWSLAAIGLSALCVPFLDKRLAHYFRFTPDLPTKKALDKVSALSAPESTLSLSGLMLAIYLYNYRKEKGNVSQDKLVYLLVPCSAFSAWVFKFGLKYLAGRTRPLVLYVNQHYTIKFLRPDKNMQSFPSGHAVMVGAMAHAFALAKPDYRTPVYALSGLLALSRVILTDHFLSDVIAGYYLGAANAQSTAWLLGKTSGLKLPVAV